MWLIGSGFRVDRTNPKDVFLDGGSYKPSLGDGAIYSETIVIEPEDFAVWGGHQLACLAVVVLVWHGSMSP